MNGCSIGATILVSCHVADKMSVVSFVGSIFFRIFATEKEI